MKYTIGNEVKELTSKAGNKFKKFNIRGEDKVVTTEVVAFTSFSKYADIVASAEIEGLLTSKDYNGKTSFTLGDDRPTGGGGGAAKAVEAKSKSIEKAQDRKEEGIMISSTASGATAILVALLSKEGTPDWRAKWIEIRHWLVKNWENTEALKVANTDIPYPTPDIDVDSIPF